MTAPRVLFLAAALDACAYFRIYLPATVCPRAEYIEPTPRPRQLDLATDVVVLQRQSTEASYHGIQSLQGAGIRVIHDIDDDLWSIPRWNPGYENVQKAKKWFDKCLGAADLITVSTPHLKGQVEKHGFGPVRVIENAIDFQFFRPLNPPAAGRQGVKIGWPSGPTHHLDGQIALAELVPLLKEFPDLYVEFVGEMPQSIQDAYSRGLIDPLRVWAVTVKIECYAEWLSARDWDFTVAPLTNAAFNKSKSFLKLLEAGSLHLPCLASDMAEYKRFCAGGLEPLLCRSRQDWRDALRWMITDAKARKELGEKVFERVRDRHQISQRARDWEAAAIAACELPAKKVDVRATGKRLEKLGEYWREQAQREQIARLVTPSPKA